MYSTSGFTCSEIINQLKFRQSRNLGIALSLVWSIGEGYLSFLSLSFRVCTLFSLLLSRMVLIFHFTAYTNLNRHFLVNHWLAAFPCRSPPSPNFEDKKISRFTCFLVLALGAVSTKTKLRRHRVCFTSHFQIFICGMVIFSFVVKEI